MKNQGVACGREVRARDVRDEWETPQSRERVLRVKLERVEAERKTCEYYY